MKDDKIQITGKVKVKCFCGAWVTAGYAGPDEEPCLLHPDPACQRYLDTDPVDFLKALRQRYSP